MRLLSLELQGFKSFPDRVKLDFHEGITGIVGPNGSGKSNISDAIRWVLGEQSAKTLRGGKMEDVIFAGTELRRSLSFAEAILTLDNSDKSLPLDFDTIEVRRRLYRSGESEYAINRKKCRLRDVHELFMDSGIGREGYSIVGQGRVDEILSARSEDRRAIFDEAGGITKHRARRNEAWRKLETVEQNLTRVDDILREIERRRGPLAKQARDAERYLALDEELRGLDIARLNHEVQRLKDEQQELDQKRLNAQHELKAKTEEREAYVTEHEAQVEALDQQRRQQEATEGRYEEAQATLQELRLKSQNLELQANQARHYLEEWERRIARAGEEAAAQAEEARALEEKRQKTQEDYERAKEERDAVQRRFDEATRETQTLQSQQIDLERQIQRQIEARLRYQAQSQEAESGFKLAEGLEKQEESFLNQVREQIARSEEHLMELRGQSQRDEGAAQASEEKLKEARQTLEALRAQKEEAQDRQRELMEEAELLQRRVRTLEHLVAGHEGYHYSLRRLMEEVEKGRVRNIEQEAVLGPLGSLISVPKELQLAIDQALGGAIQNVVVEDERTAGALIHHLRQAQLGRAVFLPLQQLTPRPLMRRDYARLEGAPGFLGLASELVPHDPRARAAIEYRLGRILIAEDLDQALELHRQSGRRFQWVTLQGDSIYPGGAMSGGQAQKRSQGLGILERQEELDSAKAKVEPLNRALQEAQRGVEGTTEDFRQASERLEGEIQDHQEKRQALLLLREQIQQEERELGRLQGELQKREWALREAAQSREEQNQRLLNLRSTEAPDESREAELVEERRAGEERLLEQRQKLEEVREALMKEEVEVGRLKETLESSRALLDRLTQERRTREARQELEGAEAEDYRQKLTTLDGERGNVREQLEAQQAICEKLQLQLQEEKRGVEEAETKNRDFIRNLTRLSDERENLQSEFMRLDHRFERLLTRMDMAMNQLWENYEITFDQTTAMSLVPYEGRASDERIMTLKRELKAMGSVNPQAIEEHKLLEERLNFIEAQKQDMLEARRDLDRLIEEISESMTTLFEESFATIQENFSRTFSELFAGGEAELRLRDSSDPLESEIDIRVCPPGKRMQNLLLLSGGERTLAAIALLFAIQQLKPTAFCLLDEVEAALDEANIFRFTEYIRRYASQTQYILVTHRKRTMEVADRLYGVTMRERGVSTVLSVKIQDLDMNSLE